MQTLVSLKLLGSLQLEQEGRSVQGFKSRKVMALLAYLLRRQDAVSRSYLADLFWGDRPEATGRANLSSALYNLSHLLPDCLRSDRHTVQFEACSKVEVDLINFETLATQGGVEALTQAVALCRGEFGADLYLNDCPDFEIWLVREREYWRQQVTRSLTTLINHFAKGGHYEQGLAFARQLLAIEPWREEGHRYLMRLLALNGQRSAALVQFETCCRVLTEELDVEPSSETVTLYEQIKAQVQEFSLPVAEALSLPFPQETKNTPLSPDPEPPSPPPASVAKSLSICPPLHNLPSQLTPFVGREIELAKIAAHLEHPECRLLTLIGPGGVGKTRLALRAAYKYLNPLEGKTDFKDGLYFVSLIGVDRAEDLLPALRDELDLPDLADQKPRQQLLSFLHNKSVLLIMDNFEQLTAGAGLLTDLLTQAPQLKILVTSQKRLNIQAEWLFTVKGLDYPPAVPPEAGEETTSSEAPYSAVELFVQNARRVQRDFLLSASDLPWVEQICRLLAGAPLAIELAAHWTRIMSCQELAQALEHSLDLLTTSLQDVPGRHRSMKTVLDYSWQLLSEPEKSAMQKLALFKGEFRREAAEQVAGVSLATLSTLIDQGLLLWEPIFSKQGGGCYQMHELLRRYALLRLEEATGSLRLYQAHFAKAVGDHATALTLIQQALRNARQAHNPEVEVGEYLRWGQILEQQDKYEAGQTRLKRALAVARRRQQRSLEAESLHEIARTNRGQGNYDQVCSSSGDALIVFRNQGNKRGGSSRFSRPG